MKTTQIKPETAYLDYVNNYISTEGFATAYGISKKAAEKLINQGREDHEKSCKRDESTPPLSQ